MLDHHLHIWPHRPGTPVPSYDQLARYVEAAAARGASEIAITEHGYRFSRIINEVVPAWQRPRTGAMADATAHVLAAEGGGDLDAYIDALISAQDRGLPLLVGLEVDWWPGAQEAMTAVLADYPFDVLLGSVHWIDEWLFDAYDTEAFLLRWETANLDEVFARYVDEVLALVDSGMVDVLAHVDVIKVGGHVAPDLVRHEKRLLAGIVAGDIAVEVSSAGLHKPVAATYPSFALLDGLVAARVPLTTASDGHMVDQVGRDLDFLRDELTSRGVSELTSFQRRKRVAVSIA